MNLLHISCVLKLIETALELISEDIYHSFIYELGNYCPVAKFGIIIFITNLLDHFLKSKLKGWT